MKNLFTYPLMDAVNESEGIDQPSYPTVSPEQFSKIIADKDVYLLDVRDKDEFAEAHIKNANNIDVLQPDFEAKAKEILPKDKTIAVYCRSGKRSKMAADILSRDGYKIVNLDGGITDWMDKGYPVVH